MTTFSQRCLPLTSNLKEPISRNAEDRKGELLTYEWEQILKILVRCIRKGEPSVPFSWDYDYDSLWSPALRDPLGHRINPYRCSPSAFLGTIRTRTHWYKRLPVSGRNRVKRLVGTIKGRMRLKDVLNTTDGVLTSLIFSFPELFLSEGGYTLSDRITSSVIMNCFHNYDRFQRKLKKLRKSIKWAGLNQKDVPINLDELRDMSYFVRPIQILNEYKKRTSKSKMFRVAMVSQTRATGLAGPGQVKESIDEFLSNVTVRREYRPNELLTQAIDDVTSELASEIRLGLNPEFKISMSTAACRESPRRNEGKFGYLKELVRDLDITIPPLSEGIPGTLGNLLWPLAKEKLDKDPDQALAVNVAAVRENGKARVVTSGSFWKDIMLQPFSHITIHLIKTISNLRSGLQAGRLGYRFIEKIWFGPGSPYNFILKLGAFLFSTDWAKATDAPTHAMGRDVVGRLLRKCGLDDESLAYVLSYWLGEKTLYYGGKPVGTLVNGIPMGDPLTKTCLSLAHPICDRYATLKTGALAIEEGNGDDTIVITDNSEYAIAHMEASEMLGYERSPMDESLSRTWGTYCEEYFYLPVSHVNTCQWGNRFQNSLLLPYLDIVKLRIVIATEKDREDFSSDPSGKATMLGHDGEYFKSREPGPHPTINAIASGFQDVCLDLVNNQKPLYLPRQVAGVGKPTPWWSVDSYMNLFKRVRPWHKKYYLVAMEELNNPGRSGVTRYKGTLKSDKHFNNEMYVETYEIPLDDPIRQKIMVHSYEWDRWPFGVLEKLVTLGYLVPESKLAKYYLFQERLEQLTSDTRRDLFEKVREELDDIPSPSPEREREIVSTFVKNFRDAPYRIKRQRCEDLYAANAVSQLEKGNPLTVDSEFPLIKKFGKRLKPGSPYEKKGQELYQWFIGRYAGLQGIPATPPSDVLEDDDIIIQQIADNEVAIYVIITDDIRLYRLARNKNPRKMIWRMSVYHYLQTNSWLEENHPGVSYDDYFEETLEDAYGYPYDACVLQDKGSTESFVAKFITKGAGVHFETIGIPWTKDIKEENLERKPLGQSLIDPQSRSMKELMFPRRLCSEREHEFLLDRAKVLISEEASDEDSDED